MVAARTWWEDSLGLPVGRTTEALQTFFLGDNTLLNLHTANSETDGLAARSTGVGLLVPASGDLARIIQRLRSRGAQISDGQLRPYLSGHVLRITGPCGNTVSVAEVDEFSDQPHMFEGPGFVTVGVSNLRRSLDFYVGRMELPMIDQLDRHTARLMSHGTQLILSEVGQSTSLAAVRGDTGICLEVDGPEYLFGQLEGRSIPFRNKPTTLGSHMLAAVTDPDGNTINLLGSV